MLWIAVRSTAHDEGRLKHSWQWKIPHVRVYTREHVADTPKQHCGVNQLSLYSQSRHSEFYETAVSFASLPEHGLILHHIWTSETVAEAHIQLLAVLSHPWHHSWLHRCHLLSYPGSQGQPRTPGTARTAQANAALLDTQYLHCAARLWESSVEMSDLTLHERRWGPAELISYTWMTPSHNSSVSGAVTQLIISAINNPQA